MAKLGVPLIAVDVHHSSDLFSGLNKDLSVEHHLTQEPSFARVAGAGDESGGRSRKNAASQVVVVVVIVVVVVSKSFLCRRRRRRRRRRRHHHLREEEKVVDDAVDDCEPLLFR
jgi:hypothetical protein